MLYLQGRVRSEKIILILRPGFINSSTQKSFAGWHLWLMTSCHSEDGILLILEHQGCLAAYPEGGRLAWHWGVGKFNCSVLLNSSWILSKNQQLPQNKRKIKVEPLESLFFPLFCLGFFWVGEGKFIPSYAVEPWNHRWSSGGIEPLPGGHGFLCKFQSIPVLWGWVGNFRKRGKRGKGISGCKWESYIKLRWWDIFKQNMFFKQNMWSFRTFFQLLRLVVY